MKYTITSIKKRLDITQDGQLREIYEIMFSTEKGAESFLRIPVEEYDAEKVKERLIKESEDLDRLFLG